MKRSLNTVRKEWVKKQAELQKIEEKLKLSHDNDSDRWNLVGLQKSITKEIKVLEEEYFGSWLPASRAVECEEKD